MRAADLWSEMAVVSSRVWMCIIGAASACGPLPPKTSYATYREFWAYGANRTPDAACGHRRSNGAKGDKGSACGISGIGGYMGRIRHRGCIGG